MSANEAQSIKEAVGKTEGLITDGSDQLAKNLLSEIITERQVLGSGAYSKYQQQLKDHYDGNLQVSAMLSCDFAVVEKMNIKDATYTGDDDLYTWEKPGPKK